MSHERRAEETLSGFVENSRKTQEAELTLLNFGSQRPIQLENSRVEASGECRNIESSIFRIPSPSCIAFSRVVRNHP